jgi:hypothetical protein
MGAGRNWLLGCGIGCGVVLLIVVLVAGGSFYFLRDAFRGFQQMEETQSTLVAQHGQIADFKPRPDGRVDAARITAFLAVRDTTTASRTSLAHALGKEGPSSPDEKPRGFAKFLKGIKAGVGFTGALADYLHERSAALLAQKMGLGEYLYTYALAYYSWLGKDPGAGPSESNLDLDLDHKRREGGVVWGDQHGDWSKPEIRRQRLRVTVHDYLLPMLEGQLAAADTLGDKAWRDDLTAEVGKLRADPGRLPWQDGLPAPLRESLEPYRAQFEAQWSAEANLLEILTLEDREGREIHVEARSDTSL